MAAPGGLLTDASAVRVAGEVLDARAAKTSRRVGTGGVRSARVRQALVHVCRERSGQLVHRSWREESDVTLDSQVEERARVK